MMGIVTTSEAYGFTPDVAYTDEFYYEPFWYKFVYMFVSIYCIWAKYYVMF